MKDFLSLPCKAVTAVWTAVSFVAAVVLVVAVERCGRPANPGKGWRRG